MNDKISTRRLIMIVIVALIAGTAIGWLLKPTGHASESAEDHAAHAHTDQIWTCSMHPQIRQSEPGKCPLCGMDLIPLKSGAGSSNPLIQQMTPEAVALANIRTTKIKAVSAEGEMNLTGRIRSDERLLASLTAKFPGRIEQLNVSFTGQFVRAGEKLGVIYSPELVTAQNELLESVKTKSTYPELYEAAREKLRLWKLNDKQINDIESAGKIKQQFDLFADKSGVVIQRNVAVGDYVTTGTPLFNVADLSRVWVIIDAFETDLPFIRIGNEVSFTVAALPGKTFKAKVTYIDPMIDPATRATSVRAETSNPGGELKPDMFITATVKTSIKNGSVNSIAIPRTALLWSGKRSIVYVKVRDSETPSFEMREISIGPRMGEMYLVESGLDEGEEIVTNGVFAIDAAAQLSGNYSMLSRPKSKMIETSPGMIRSVGQITDAYFTLKNALVESDFKAAKNAIPKIKTAISAVNAPDNAKEQWTELRTSLDHDVNALTNAADIENMRTHFQGLSDNIAIAIETFGTDKDHVYKDYCPMAFDNTGAHWLSETEDIRNPYFGDAMLACGEVKQTFRKSSP